MKTRPIEADFIHVDDRRRDRRDEVNSRISQLCKRV